MHIPRYDRIRRVVRTRLREVAWSHAMLRMTELCECACILHVFYILQSPFDHFRFRDSNVLNRTIDAFQGTDTVIPTIRSERPFFTIPHY
ncbi:hypothetical protein BU26DRAFT_286415 [Trematosphaeria pertusa]|uniref:Uncharacterized protein n=1 Tax=Trematosphaeria pertusa TaxID=390896 RepID=A0A6A6IMD2_9PLEO|nr:uncharacterized protein BU26DRAFT_286415 [Trematosphaeria pertusa]KAF2251576.1 hypothetical protein BU26DRAFT_286415 [Trematosphaeria pertusa]